MFWPADAGQARPAGSAPLYATLRAAAMPAQAALPAPERAAPAPRRMTQSTAGAPAVSASASGGRAALPAAAPMPAGAAFASVAGAGRPGAGSAAASVTDAPAEAPDADGIRFYRLGLAREARSHRRYPPLALERGWTGTAEVQVDVSRHGQARQVLLARSSGHEILDREAVAMMSRAAVTASLPASLQGREFAVRLPVVFDLADAQ